MSSKCCYTWAVSRESSSMTYNSQISKFKTHNMRITIINLTTCSGTVIKTPSLWTWLRILMSWKKFVHSSKKQHACREIWKEISNFISSFSSIKVSSWKNFKNMLSRNIMLPDTRNSLISWSSRNLMKSIDRDLECLTEFAKLSQERN